LFMVGSLSDTTKKWALALFYWLSDLQ